MRFQGKDIVLSREEWDKLQLEAELGRLRIKYCYIIKKRRDVMNNKWFVWEERRIGLEVREKELIKEIEQLQAEVEKWMYQ